MTFYLEGKGSPLDLNTAIGDLLSLAGLNKHDPETKLCLRYLFTKCHSENAANHVAPPPAASETASNHAAPLPAAIEDAANHGGDGGCTAKALHIIGVFESVAAATQALDAKIDTVHASLQSQRGPCNRSDVGIPGEQWHAEVVKAAVTDAGWHFRTQPFKRDTVQGRDVDLKQVFGEGSFLLIGVTNNAWMSGKKRKWKYAGHTADEPHENPTAWLHSIAVVNSRFHEETVSGSGDTTTESYPLSSLWLQDNNQPDPRKGYMRTIRRVWRLRKCTAPPGSNCKGMPTCLAEL